MQGKGKDYSATVEVQPSEPLEVLKRKVHFFKIFYQRKQQLVEKSTEKVIEDYGKSFSDYDLKDGASLMMREPGKKLPNAPQMAAPARSKI